MPNVTITSIPVSPCGHREIVTDKGTLHLHASDIADARPGTFEEKVDAFIIVLRHEYQTRRAAGATPEQAMSSLIGFVVRL